MLYANNVRSLMARYADIFLIVLFRCGCIRVASFCDSKLNLPTSDHSFEDIRLMKAGTQQSLPLHAGMVEFVKLKSHLQ